jgi:hypothetical protein
VTGEPAPNQFYIAMTLASTFARGQPLPNLLQLAGVGNRLLANASEFNSTTIYWTRHEDAVVASGIFALLSVLIR